jgi:tetratricopeptide (TPR) repeat protein
LAENGGLFSARPSLLRSLVEARIAAGDHDNALATLERARRDQPAELPLWWRLEAKVWSAKQEFGSRDRALRSALDCDRSLVPTETLRAIDAEGLSEKMVAVYKTQLAALSGLHADPAPVVADSALQAGDATALRQPALRSPGPGSGGVESAPAPALRAVRSRQAPPPWAAGSAPPSSVGAPGASQRPAAPAVPRQVPPRSPAEDTADRELRVQCLTALGHLYEWRGQYRDGMAVWQDLTRLRGSGNDWFLLAQSLERASRWTEARDAWRKAVRSGELTDPARKHAAKKLSALGG